MSKTDFERPSSDSIIRVTYRPESVSAPSVSLTAEVTDSTPRGFGWRCDLTLLDGEVEAETLRLESRSHATTVRCEDREEAKRWTTLGYVTAITEVKDDEDA